MAAQRSPKPFVGVRVPPGKPIIVRWPSGPRQLPAKQLNRGFESHPHFHLGDVVLMGTHLFCKQELRVRFSPSPPFYSDWDNW